MNVWDSDNQKLKQLLMDMGFEPWASVPYWVEQLAERIIEMGWKK